MPGRYEEITVAITAEHYAQSDGSLQNALITAIGDALAAGDPAVCAALSVDTYDMFYNEDELYPADDTVDDDMAIAHDTGYTIAQVKTEPTDEHRGELPLPEQQVNAFERAMQLDGRDVAAKYTIVGQCDDAGRIEQAFRAGDCNRYAMTCGITQIPLQSEPALDQAMAVLDDPVYKAGTWVDRPPAGRLTSARLTVRIGPGQVGPDRGAHHKPLHSIAA